MGASVSPSCAGYMGHSFKKSLFDNDDSAFQAPFLRTEVLSSQYRVCRGESIYPPCPIAVPQKWPQAGERSTSFTLLRQPTHTHHLNVLMSCFFQHTSFLTARYALKFPCPPVLLQHQPFSGGTCIGFQFRAKARMAIRELINAGLNGLHMLWIGVLPVAQPVKRTFPAGI